MKVSTLWAGGGGKWGLDDARTTEIRGVSMIRNLLLEASSTMEGFGKWRRGWVQWVDLHAYTEPFVRNRTNICGRSGV